MRDRLLLAALKTVPTSLAEHVTREFLDILPRLQQGVWVRVHDIFFPHDHPAEC